MPDGHTAGRDHHLRGQEIARRVERFVRETIIPYEHDPRRDAHGPTE